jgi:hypothetical protein
LTCSWMRSASCAKRCSNVGLGWLSWMRNMAGSPDGSGGSVQHSLSPMDADTDAVIGHFPTSGSGASGQYCSHRKSLTKVNGPPMVRVARHKHRPYGLSVPQRWVGNSTRLLNSNG